jgi:hypothetical protein
VKCFNCGKYGHYVKDCKVSASTAAAPQHATAVAATVPAAPASAASQPVSEPVKHMPDFDPVANMSFELMDRWLTARLARFRGMTVEEMNAQPSVPLNDELTGKMLDTLAVPALLHPHKAVVCAQPNPADPNAFTEDQLIAAFVAEDLRLRQARLLLSHLSQRGLTMGAASARSCSQPLCLLMEAQILAKSMAMLLTSKVLHLLGCLLRQMHIAHLPL